MLHCFFIIPQNHIKCFIISGQLLSGYDHFTDSFYPIKTLKFLLINNNKITSFGHTSFQYGKPLIISSGVTQVRKFFLPSKNTYELINTTLTIKDLNQGGGLYILEGELKHREHFGWVVTCKLFIIITKTNKNE